MKKAKIMLMAIAIFGVIGGALAFKTAKFGGPVFLCTTTVLHGPTICTKPGYTTTNVGGTLSTVYATTASTTAFSCSTSSGGITTYCINGTPTLITALAGE